MMNKKDLDIIEMAMRNQQTPRTVTEYVPYEKTITINKSSAAEDAKLLKQLEDEALSKISNRIAESIGDNKFEIVRYDLSDCIMDGSKRMLIIFKLNEITHTIKVIKSDWQQEVADYITSELRNQILQTVFSTWNANKFMGMI